MFFFVFGVVYGVSEMVRSYKIRKRLGVVGSQAGTTVVFFFSGGISSLLSMFILNYDIKATRKEREGRSIKLLLVWSGLAGLVCLVWSLVGSVRRSGMLARSPGGGYLGAWHF